MDSKLNLHTVLTNSYAKKKAKNLNGYELDEGLSNHNQQVYFHPKEKKLLYSITGTHNLDDWGTDIKLGTGIGFKESKRYKDADNTLKAAKAKYGVDTATVAGHSLGGSLAGYVSSKNDKVFTLDKGATIGQKVRNNEDGYRASGDLVSALNAKSKHMKTVSHPTSLIGSLGKAAFGYITGNPAAGLSAARDVLSAHDVDAIKDEGIFV